MLAMRALLSVGAQLSGDGTGRGSCARAHARGSGGRPLSGTLGARCRAWPDCPIVHRGGVGGREGQRRALHDPINYQFNATLKNNLLRVAIRYLA